MLGSYHAILQYFLKYDVVIDKLMGKNASD
jgi:hypothetical protein